MRLSNLLSARVNEKIAMLSPKHIADAAHRLVAQDGHPAKVILFGSYARGKADEASDLDLMVVKNGLKDKAAEYLRLRDAIGRTGVGVDLLLVSEQEFESRSQVPGTAAHWAKTEGKVLDEPFRITPLQ